MKKNFCKKLLSLLLVLICALSLAACGGKNSLAGTYKLQSLEMEGMSMDLEEMSDQFLADINTPFFAEAANEYEGTNEYAGFTSENILQIHEAILSYETDRDAERDLNRHEAEFGADGTRVFRDDEER